MAKPKASQTAQEFGMITAAGAANISFTKQVSGFEDSLLVRRQAEQEVKANRIICIDMLTEYGVDLGGRPLQPEQLEEVSQRIQVLGPQPKVPEIDKIFATSSQSDYVSYIVNNNGAGTDAIRKGIGVKGMKFLQHVSDLRQQGVPQAQVDLVATDKARATFKTAFNKFRDALNRWEDAKSQIDDVKEYVGVVKDIATIGETKGRGRN